MAGLPYQTKSIVVELNPAQTAKEKAQWVKVKLVFCRGVDPDKDKASKHDWALFLSTDTLLTDEKILEIYKGYPLCFTNINMLWNFRLTTYNM